jgi:hypothetical protein
MIIMVSVVAALATGLFLGWVLRASSAVTAASWSQDRMHTKVTYWQDRAIRLEQQLEGRGNRPEPPSGQWWQ